MKHSIVKPGTLNGRYFACSEMLRKDSQGQEIVEGGLELGVLTLCGLPYTLIYTFNALRKLELE